MNEGSKKSRLAPTPTPPPSDFFIDEADLRLAFDRIVHRNLPTVCLGLLAVYLVLTLAQAAMARSASFKGRERPSITTRKFFRRVSHTWRSALKLALGARYSPFSKVHLPSILSRSAPASAGFCRQNRPLRRSPLPKISV